MNRNKVYIFAGPNGVGKSTLGDIHSSDKNLTFINPDAIKKQQEYLYNETINSIQLNYVLDINICNALENDGEVLIESNLHNEDAYRFILSYINSYNADSLCNFYYVDDVNILIDRVAERVGHLGHEVPEETIRNRYRDSLKLISENISVFNEIHFYDNSNFQVSNKIIEIVDGEINYVNSDISFDWSDQIIERFL